MNEFEKLVFKMREAQSYYFKNRTSYSLQRSKFLEEQVDKHLDGINQPKLF